MKCFIFDNLCKVFYQGMSQMINLYKLFQIISYKFWR